MSQLAQPYADVAGSVNGWSPQPVYSTLRKAMPPDPTQPFDYSLIDQTYISSAGLANGDGLQVGLPPLAYPGGPGNKSLVLRLRQPDADPVNPPFVTALLLNGGSIVAGQNFRVTSEFGNYVLNLTDAQMAQITDYSNLTVQVVACGPTVPCCPTRPIPTVLFGTLTSSCDCLNGTSFPLVYQEDVSDNIWLSPSTQECKAGPNVWVLSCNSQNQWTLGAATAICFSPATGPLTIQQCSPFLMAYEGMPGMTTLYCNCGGTTVTLTITE